MKSFFLVFLSFFIVGACLARVVAVSPATNYFITVYNQYGNTRGVVNTKISDNPGLADLTLNSGTLAPAFTTGNINYTALVSSAKTSVAITPTASDPTATIKVNGKAATSGMASASIPLAIGSNVITIVVTAQDGITTKAYTVSVIRPSTNASLSRISLSPYSTLTTTTGPGFANFTASVPNSEASVQVIPTVADPTATITVNGKAAASGVSSATVALSVGVNNIAIVAKAQDGVTTKTYFITVTRAASTVIRSTNASLSRISLSPYSTLTTTTGPGFANYTASVPNSEASVQVIPTVADPTATITVNGKAAASGVSSATVALSVGVNNIAIIAKAQDGVTTKTYFITVTRAASAVIRSTNASLSRISLSPYSTLTTTTGPGFANYTASVPNSEASVQVIPTVADPTATITVNGKAAASGVSSATVALSVGVNNIAIIAKAEDGVTSKTYFITVTRAASAVLVINNNITNTGANDSQPLNVKVYPSPGLSSPSSGFAKTSDKYEVSVTQNGVTQQSFVYKTSSGSGPSSQWGNQTNKSLHFTTFSFSGTVIVTVTKLNCIATTAVVRPTRKLTAPIVVTQGANKTVSISIGAPGKFSVEFSDDPGNINPLMIFANALETNVPSPTASNVLLATSVTTAASLASIPTTKTIVYFPPGVYSLGGQWTIPNTVKQVYIAGGAYVKGYLYRNNVLSNAATNTITINGRGVLSNEGFSYHYPSSPADGNANNWYYPICLRGGLNHLVEGITLIEASAFNILINAATSMVQNVNINGFMYNNDGITIQGTGNAINNCFIRSNDDGIVPYAINTTTPACNLTISNCTFWQLHGTIIQMGWSPHSMSGFNISNCDVIHDENTNPNGNTGFINAMLYSPTSLTTAATVSNINVNTIYFDTPVLRFLSIVNDRATIMTSPPCVYTVPWVFNNFTISNIYFKQTVRYPLVLLHGYSAINPINNVSISNIYLNSAKLAISQVGAATFCDQQRVTGLTIQ